MFCFSCALFPDPTINKSMNRTRKLLTSLYTECVQARTRPDTIWRVRMKQPVATTTMAFQLEIRYGERRLDSRETGFKHVCTTRSNAFHASHAFECRARACRSRCKSFYAHNHPTKCTLSATMNDSFLSASVFSGNGITRAYEPAEDP